MRACLFVIALLPLAGCGGSADPKAGKDILSGKVLVGDQPARQVIITVTGQDGKVAGGTTSEAGEYTIPDPPKGKLKFMVSGSRPGAKLAPNAPSVVPPKYSNPNELEFDYAGGKQTFDLKMTP